MYSNFRKTRGSLSWLSNYLEALLVVYNLITEEKRGYVMEKDREFDENVYL